MGSRRRIVRIVVPTVLAALEWVHPTWTSGTIAQAVLAAGGWWVPLHGLLIAGYAALVYLLWVGSAGALARTLLVVFLVCNTVFLGADGIGVGLLAVTDPEGADRLWNSPLVMALANLTGAAWAASLLGVAAVSVPGARGRPALLGLGLTWLTFVASAPPLGLPAIVSRLVAVATGASVVYASGAGAVSFALLVFAAVLHQHVGAEAALGLVLVGIALAQLGEPG